MTQSLLKKPRVSREIREGAILEAAIACVMRSGFHGASMGDIAREAGMSVGIIYRYFANKEAIIEAIVARDIAELKLAISDKETVSREMIIDKVRESVAATLVRQYDRKHSALRLEIYAEAARNPKVEAIVTNYANIEREVFKHIMRKSVGTLSEETLDARADVFRAMLDGLLVQGICGKKTIEVAILNQLSPIMLLLWT